MAVIDIQKASDLWQNFPSSKLGGRYEKRAVEESTLVYLQSELDAGYGIFLEGNIKSLLHEWRHQSECKESRLVALQEAVFFLNKLIEDVQQHDIPKCHD